MPESGRGQPHSKTLARFSARLYFRKVEECGCPLPLSYRLSVQATTTINVLLTGPASSV
jgi:hypothetical protein